MSTAESTLPRLPALFGALQSLAAVFAERIAAVVRGVAFWASIPLPLVVLATLLTVGLTGAPFLVGGLVALNVACMRIGHSHSPSI